jgi:DNA-binding response OmpR family regulator
MRPLEEIRLADGAALYPQLRCIRKKGCEIVRLSRRQSELLEALALCAGALVTNRMLIAALYGRQGRRAERVTLVALVCRLKRKLESALEGVRIFHVRNHGYVLACE